MIAKMEAEATTEREESGITVLGMVQAQSPLGP